MELQPPAPATAALPAPPPAHAYAPALAELVSIGLALTRLVEGQAHALTRGEAPQTIAKHLPNLTRAFEGLARSIRHTAALDARLAKAAARPASLTDAERARRAARRLMLRRAENAIAERAPAPERENLLRDLHERFEDPEFDEALLTTPPDMFFEHLASDLGIRGKFSANVGPRSQADIAALNARVAYHPSG